MLHAKLDARKSPPLWRIFARAKGGKNQGRIAYDEEANPLDGGGYATEQEAISRIASLHPIQALRSESRVYMQARAKYLVSSLPSEPLPQGRRDDPVAVAHHHGVDPLADSMPSLRWIQTVERRYQEIAADVLEACNGDTRAASDALEDAGRWTAAAESMRSGVRPYLYARLQSAAVHVEDVTRELSDSERTAALAEIQRSIEARKIAERKEG